MEQTIRPQRVITEVNGGFLVQPNGQCSPDQVHMFKTPKEVAKFVEEYLSAPPPLPVVLSESRGPQR